MRKGWLDALLLTAQTLEIRRLRVSGENQFEGKGKEKRNAVAVHLISRQVEYDHRDIPNGVSAFGTSPTKVHCRH